MYRNIYRFIALYLRGAYIYNILVYIFKLIIGFWFFYKKKFNVHMCEKYCKKIDKYVKIALNSTVFTY